MIRLSGNKMVRPICFGRSRYPFGTKTVKPSRIPTRPRPRGFVVGMPSGYDRGEPGLIASGMVMERTGDPMKFDVERAVADIRELGDARFAGPDGEAKVVDFLAGRFESIGYRVERREAAGARFSP